VVYWPRSAKASTSIASLLKLPSTNSWNTDATILYSRLEDGVLRVPNTGGSLCLSPSWTNPFAAHSDSVVLGTNSP